jgi:hypothetical protein
MEKISILLGTLSSDLLEGADLASRRGWRCIECGLGLLLFGALNF